MHNPPIRIYHYLRKFARKNGIKIVDEQSLRRFIGLFTESGLYHDYWYGTNYRYNSPVIVLEHSAINSMNNPWAKPSILLHELTHWYFWLHNRLSHAYEYREISMISEGRAVEENTVRAVVHSIMSPVTEFTEKGLPPSTVGKYDPERVSQRDLRQAFDYFAPIFYKGIG